MSDYQDRDPLKIERFETIYYSTVDQLLAFVRKNATGNEMVDDIVQECYVAIWNKLHELQDDDRVINLLRTIARRQIIDAHRKKSSEFLRSAFFYHQQETVQFNEDDLHYKELLQGYKKAIEEMPPKRRQIYLLVKEKGMSHQQIAAMLNISTNTIEKQINSAMRTLRTKFSSDKIMFAIILVRLAHG